MSAVIVPKPKLVCLLSARNCEADLDGYFASVARFADAVVALDDGSTDGTGDGLAAQPLVRRVLGNPRRDGYAGWDQAANLSQLLAAAADLQPEWIVTVDADERIDADDAEALRCIVDREGRPGHAYLFRQFRMVGDEGWYDRCEHWAPRLFPWEAGQRLPAHGLHLPPVPTSIPYERWIRTTIRLKHLSGLTDARRRARFEKYREADPQRDHQPTYAHLLDAPARVRRWRPRPPALPAIAGARSGDGHGSPSSAPAMSLVIGARSDGARLRRAVRSALRATGEATVEIVVALAANADALKRDFPTLTVVAAEDGETGALRAAARVARGRFLWMLPVNAELTPGAIEHTLAAHDEGYAIVLPHARPDTRGVLARGAVLAEHGAAVASSPRPAPGQPDCGCSYLRDAVVDLIEEPGVAAGNLNLALLDWGYSSFRLAAPSMILRAPGDGLAGLLARQFRRGRDAAQATQVIAGSWLSPSRRFGVGPLRARTRASAQLAVNQLRVTAPRRAWRDAGAALPLVLAGQVAFGLGAAYHLFACADYHSTR